MTLYGAQVELKGGYAHFSTARFPHFVFIQTALYSDFKVDNNLKKSKQNLFHLPQRRGNRRQEVGRAWGGTCS